MASSDDSMAGSDDSDRFTDDSDRFLNVPFAGRIITTTVTSQAATVCGWLSDTLHLHSRRPLIVGLGVQWVPSHYPDPSTLQLCIGRRCLIFQLPHCDYIPDMLARFLEGQDYGAVTFAGVNIDFDRRLLSEKWGLAVGATEEIRHLAAGKMGRWNASIADIADEILGIHCELVRDAKPMYVGRSEWDALDLSYEQILYACVDAYLSCRLGVVLIWGA